MSPKYANQTFAIIGVKIKNTKYSKDARCAIISNIEVIRVGGKVIITWEVTFAKRTSLSFTGRVRIIQKFLPSSEIDDALTIFIDDIRTKALTRIADMNPEPRIELSSSKILTLNSATMAITISKISPSPAFII